MMQVSNAQYSLGTMWPAEKSAAYLFLRVGAIIFSIGVVIGMQFVFPNDEDIDYTTGYLSWIIYVVAGVLFLTLLMIIFIVPVSFEFAHNALKIHNRLCVSKTVPYASITNVRLGNVVGFVGWKCRSTMALSNAVIIEKSGMNILITPENSEGFIAKLKESVAEVGGRTGAPASGSGGSVQPTMVQPAASQPSLGASVAYDQFGQPVYSQPAAPAPAPVSQYRPYS